MPALDRGARSTLHVSDDGRTCHRVYHDTGRRSASVPVRRDERGVARGAGNRDLYRGTARPDPPEHLRNALAFLCRRPRDVGAMARQLGVRESTAWCYACQVVIAWPTAHDVACGLVQPEVLRAVRDTNDLSGSLQDLWRRLHSRIGHALREDEDRYAHLRLARACAEAERAIA